MKICMVGLGSMGARHLRNLPDVLAARGIPFQIDAFRNSDRELSADIQGLLTNQYFDEAKLPDDYDVAFICSPTSEHSKSIRMMLPRAKHLFIEKPVFVNCDEGSDIPFRMGHIYYVACPLRYSRLLITLRDMLQGKKVFSARVISSTYLPDWRPNTDYRKIYSANAKLGGGVELDMIHEWDYVCWLFGFPQEVSAFVGKVSNLETDSNDAAVYIGKYPDKLVSVYLDYFGNPWKREIELYTSDGIMVADLTKQEIRLLKDGTVLECPEDRDTMQKRELGCFFDIIDGKCENTNSIETAIKTLSVAKGEYCL